VALALALIDVVVALNVAVVALAATVTDAGTMSKELVLDSVMAALPPGAAWLKVTAHVEEAFGPRLAGLHDNPVIVTEATRLTVELAELPLYAAVIVALALALIDAVVALNVAVVALAATVTDAGTVSEELVLESVMAAAPLGAG
jgi:hypothetical protein